jgi:hypothetical protein
MHVSPQYIDVVKRRCTMRRQYAPFNGKRYILDKKTGVAHDLDNEVYDCKIRIIAYDKVDTADDIGEILKNPDFKVVCDHCIAKFG